MPNRNATPSINGWFFQISAGMFLFLRNIKKSNFLKIEGENEDIEIETDDGMMFAQAKCLYDVNSRKSVNAHYKKALQTLKDNGKQAAKLIYISNIEDPFEDGEEKLYSIDSEFEFGQLKKITQDKIRTILGNDFDYEKLSIIIKHFYGTYESKKKMLIEQISRFLIASIGDDSYKDAAYNKLITDGLINASDRKYQTTKSKFIFTLIMPYLETVRIKEELIAGDEDAFDEAEENYYMFLQSLEADYGNISKILADFKSEKDTSGIGVNEYTVKCYDRFLEMIPDNYEEAVRKELCKILIYRILRQHSCLERVKKVANLR